jgi:hypothetical protein
MYEHVQNLLIRCGEKRHRNPIWIYGSLVLGLVLEDGDFLVSSQGEEIYSIFYYYEKCRQAFLPPYAQSLIEIALCLFSHF